ncbi:hypothetical protein F1C16_05225 [Hymenobacter sp. NBH84]|uniref:hypothetical protein n=1 Tax=Hymenobacter sp. NBH84 TaxID=2596915 RepID=UPI00162897C4|nr:hypothetical protein [Hymenobacter sp. NBH84]QNE38997.1 hypothetical protein F1C16_05225 [Hymenobacter sp. NBH84]
MPIEEIKESYIYQLPQIVTPQDLYNTKLEVEKVINGEPANHSVSFGTMVTGVANALPKGNNSSSLYKVVRTYDTTLSGYEAGYATLVDLDPRFLCLGTICFVEFPHPSREYRLVYDPNSSLNVAVDGSFNGNTIGGRWVEKDSLEDKYSRIVEFNPFENSYQKDDIVKYVLNGTLTLFAAKQTLIKSTFPGNAIPEPTGNVTDQYWQKLGASDGVENPGYDDTELRGRVEVLEAADIDLLGNIETAKTNLNNRIDGIVTAVIPYVPDSYSFGQLVHSGGLIFMARQDIANSTVAPTATNAYWLLVNGTSSGSTSSGTVDLSNYYTKAQTDAIGNTKVEKRTGYSLVSDNEIARLATIQNYVLLDNSVTEAKLSPEVRAKLNAVETGYNDSELRNLVAGKVDKVTGKSLIADTEIARLATLSGYNDTNLTNRVIALENAPEPTGYDDTELRSEVDAIDTRVTTLENAPAVEPFDNTSNDSRLTALENAPGFDDTAIVNRLDTNESELTGIDTRVTALENRPTPTGETGTIDSLNDEKVLVGFTGITETIGGLTPGNFTGTLEDLLTKILIKYQAPFFSGFNYNGAGSRTVEAGTTFTGVDTFSWSIGNNNNTKPSTITIKSNGNVIGSGLANNGSQTLDLPTFTLDAGQSRSFSIEATNSQNNVFTGGLTINTQLARYYGASSLTPGELKAQLANNANGVLSNKDLGGGRGLESNFNCSGGKYPYYLYQAGFGNPGSVQQGPNNFSAYTVEDIVIKDVFGILRNYKLFYTDTIQFSSSFNLRIN